MTTPCIDRPPRRPLRRLAAVLSSAAVLTVLAGVAPSAPPAAADQLAFPFDDEFDDASGGILSGSAQIVDGRLRLTDDVPHLAGAWAMADAFPSDRGLEIEFRYAMYSDGDGPHADGLLLYLADGSAPAGVGADGAGLGYSCRGSSASGAGPCTVPGIPGGVAAVALDSFGNFSLPLNDSGPGAAPDNVVIRGSGDGTAGYRFVRGAPVLDDLSTDGPTTRTVRVALVPTDDGGLSMSVRLQIGGGLRTVLGAVPLAGDGQSPLPPTLRLGFAGATGKYADVHEVDALHVRQPADLRVVHDLPPTVSAGEHVRYGVTASNVGTNDSAPSPFAVDVPDGLHDVTWTCSAAAGASCGTPSGTGGVATELDLPRGGSATFVVEGSLDPAAQGVMTSRATIATAPDLGDVDESDNESIASAPVSAVAQLETDKTLVTAGPVHPGDEVEYLVTARNRGPAVARSVGVVDELPQALTFSGSADDCAADGRSVTCRSGKDLAPGQSADFRLRARLDARYAGDGSDVVNVATATSPTDPDGGDPSPEVPITVVQPDPGPGDGDEGDDGGDHGGGDGDDHDGGDRDGADAGEVGAAAADDGAVPAAGGATRGAAGALAYTGADGLLLGAGAAVGLLGLGAVVAAVRMRGRRRADAVGSTSSSEPGRA